MSDPAFDVAIPSLHVLAGRIVDGTVSRRDAPTNLQGIVERTCADARQCKEYLNSLVERLENVDPFSLPEASLRIDE